MKPIKPVFHKISSRFGDTLVIFVKESRFLSKPASRTSFRKIKSFSTIKRITALVFSVRDIAMFCFRISPAILPSFRTLISLTQIIARPTPIRNMATTARTSITKFGKSARFGVLIARLKSLRKSESPLS